MLTIPSGDAALAAWAALPAGVRADVAERAARNEGHPDPVVAAVVVGYIRAGGPRPWWRRVGATGGMVFAVGVTLAELGRRGAVDYLMLLVNGGLGLFVAAAAVYAPILLRIPVKAEAPNLAVFLESPDAGTAPPPRHWRPVLIGTAVLLVGAPVVAFAQVQLTDIHFDLAALVARLAKYAAISLAAFVVGRIYANFPVSKDRARWVSVGQRGVRFGWRRSIPWTDVADVTVVGPDPDDPDDRGSMVWTLYKGPVVRAPLQASRRRPEDLVLTARAHMLATTR